MSKYLELLKDSKENRIMEVLKETENFLKEIALRIAHSKHDNYKSDRYVTDSAST